MTELVDRQIGPYRVIRRLGAGGMGEVYLAEDGRLGRRVALKVIGGTGEEAAARKRLIREARAAAAIDHPGVCTIYEVSDGPVPFIAMQYIDGEPLSGRLQRAVSQPEVVQVALQLARSLAAAHLHGIIHRDIKPQNVMITRDDRAILLDFGLARITAAEPLSKLTATGTIVGTLSYMSPEQIGGEELDARSDIFSLGAVIYEMLCGRPPFDRGSMAATLAAVLFEQPSLDAVPDAWRPLLSRALAKDRRARFAGMHELARELEIIAGTTPAEPATDPDAATATLERPFPQAATPSSSLGDRRSLAVMPFAAPAADEEAEYLAEGLTEAAIDALSRQEGLRVMARSTVFRYSGIADPCEFGRTLNVGCVLAGEIRRRGERVVLNLELVDTSSGERLWGSRIERMASELSELHSDVGRAVREPFAEKHSTAPADPSKPRDPEAFRLFLVGRHQWNRRTGPATRLAIENFQGAIDIDPTFAPAHVGLADSLAYLAFLEVISPREAFPRARAAAEKALALAPDLAEAITSAAFVKSHHEFDFPAAEVLYRRAIEKNPNYAVAHHWYGLSLLFRGRIDEGEVQLRAAQQLDPLNPIVNVATAFAPYYRRDYTGAIAIYRPLVEMEPHFMPLRNYYGNALTLAGEPEAAIEQFEVVRPISGESTVLLASLGFALARAGRGEEARQILRQLDEIRTSRYSSSFAPAVIHAGLEEPERAFAWLNRALEDRSPWLITLSDPRFDSVRADPRFPSLLERIGYWSGDSVSG
jgi:eukaryotic-like serine/threonine-protein kinase